MRKTPAQLDAEIAEALALAGPATIRRGRLTDAVFARTAGAISHFSSTTPGTGRPIATTERISTSEARDRFDQAPRAKMQRRADGVYFFVIGTPVGYERIELIA